MKKKINKKALNEELKRFKLLNEYDFYIGEDEDSEDSEDEVDNLILGEEGEDEEEEEEDLPADDSNTSKEDGGDESDIDLEDDFEDESDIDLEDDFEDESDSEFEDSGDEVELDVTDLVKGTEEAKESSEEANQNIDRLMNMVDDLEGKLSSMDNIADKIDSLEQEIEKRAPTPKEKLEMRSLDSYPYNLKLTDFWGDGKDNYEVSSDESEDEEYVLTQKDVEEEYNEPQIKSSFNDDNPYEEEYF